MKIMIRDLEPEDAKISWRWRNDPEVWNLTGRKWNNEVTEEIERKWIDSVIMRKDEKRFAICVGKNEIYIGNVQLTNITEVDAVFHIFIGEKKYWGKGIGTITTKLIIDYAFSELKLRKINLYVKKQNKSALKVYEKVGFIIKENLENDYLMSLLNESN